MARITRFEVRRDDIASHRWREEPLQMPQPDEALLAVERFAFTSNNVTYAAMGERMQYWDFFPAEPGWGCIPVWAYLRVLESAVDGVAPGQRFYGYAPMASHVYMRPVQVSARGFTDAAACRQPLPPVYNQYLFAAGHDEQLEALEMLLRPLFLTSFVLHEFLQRRQWFDARRIVISSASSKTAYGTAFFLERSGAPEVVGLTSAANREFVDSLGCYGQVLGYDALESLPADDATLYVDFSGSATLRSRVHHHFAALTYSCSVGATQWDAGGGAGDLPGPRPELFFAPSHIKGNAGLQQRMADGWRELCVRVLDPEAPWMVIRNDAGKAATERIYSDMLHNRSSPRIGQLLALG